MSWRDTLRPASFRGVGFEVSASSLDLGRRFAVHEFPLRDSAEVEDMGRKGRAHSVEAYLVGPNYHIARDQLIDALEAPGLGALVHPWLGSRDVAFMSGRVSETTAEDGMCRFSLEFFEPVLTSLTRQSTDTAAKARTEAQGLSAASSDDFAKRFKVTGLADFVSEAAADNLNSAADFISNSRVTLTGASAPLNSFIAKGKAFKSQILTLMRSPLDLALGVSGLISGLRDVASTPLEALGVLKSAFSFGQGFAQVVGQTQSRVQQAQNQAALIDLVRQNAASEALKASSQVIYPSYNEAITARDDLSDRIYDLALTAALSGQDDVYQALEAARIALITDINARSADLARIYKIDLDVSQPALVAAFGLYGADDLERRQQEIITRNGAPHPLFLRGSLEVLTNG
jgi:prophage DNA circulation protein